MKLLKLNIFLLFFFFLSSNQNLWSFDEKKIKEIEDYLNNFNNIKSRFIQSSSEGLQTQGDIYLSKPGKIRIEYEKKQKLLIVADGKWIHYFDLELNEVQSVIIDKSPARILLKKKINLKKDFKITKLTNKSGKIVLTLVDEKLENVKNISLVFSSKPLALKKWIILDSQEVETTVALLNLRKNKKFSEKTFLLIK